ncbi:MAG: NAD(P)/FAD-dependent oxidoreductase [Planctomycetes bacterium]|nr:NAD(P)/FAD-dependent oxidoreductase [Planctomycetota bacterium]
MSPDFDVIVVGAGPAGSTLAAFLGKRGVRTLLLDRATFPREKLCGEYMSPQTLATLERLGVLDRIESLPHRKLLGHDIWSYDGVRMRGRFIDVGPHRPPRPYGLVVRRALFDHELLKRAREESSVTAILGFRVDGLLREAGEVRGVRGAGPGGEKSFTARLVVGADGITSVVARELGLARLDDRVRKCALVGYWKGMDPPDYGEVHLGDPGYFALAPVDDATVNINFVLDGEALKAARGDVERFYDSHVQSHPRLGPRLRGGGRVGPVLATGPLARRNIGTIAPGALLIGDSAEFVDPVTGEGIFMAIRSGELAAGLVAEALLSSPGALHLRSWPAVREAEFGDRLRSCWRVQRYLGRRWTINKILRRLATRPDLADRAISVSGDYAPPGLLYSFRFILSFLNPFARRAVAREPADASVAEELESSRK